jgi:hypothetical protein
MGLFIPAAIGRMSGKQKRLDRPDVVDRQVLITRLHLLAFAEHEV